MRTRAGGVRVVMLRPERGVPGAVDGGPGQKEHPGGPSSSSADVHPGPPFGIGFGLAQDFAGDGGDFAVADEQET